MRLLLISVAFAFTACVGVVTKPCTTGGEASAAKPVGGTKKCSQRKDRGGKWVNDGEYVEWYPNGNRAIEGEYRWGKKNGKWTEWDEAGKKTGEHFYDEGTEIPRRDPAPKGIPTVMPSTEPSPSPAPA